MAIKTILVPFTNRRKAGCALDVALLLARDAAAHLEGVYAPTDMIELLPPDYRGRLSGYEHVLADVKSEIEEHGRLLRRRFDALVADAGIEIRHRPPSGGTPSASWQVVRGPADEAVRRIGGAYDLIAVDLPAQGAEEEDAAIIEAALFGTGRGVLMCPPLPVAAIGKSVMIGWNRSAQAARAVERALPILARARRIVVFSVTTGAKQGPSAAELARYLAWHDLEAEVHEVSPNQRHVGENVLAHAHELGVDLLVMGAYSHGRLRQLILGGVTQHVAHHARLPVLLTH